MTDQHPQLNLRKQPKQSRSIDLCNAIKEATARLLCQRELEGFSTNDVADLAGVSIGSLYQYYPAKEAIVAELIRDMRAQMLQDMHIAQTQTAGLALDQMLPAILRAAIHHHRANPTLTQMLEQAEAALPLDQETEALRNAVYQIVFDVLSDAAIDNAAEVARDVIALSRGLFDAAIVQGESDFAHVERRLIKAALRFTAP